MNEIKKEAELTEVLNGVHSAATPKIWRGSGWGRNAFLIKKFHYFNFPIK